MCENVCGAAVRAGESACVGRCVRVRPFVPFWGTAGVALKTAPDDAGSGPRRGNGFWFDKRPTGGGRPIHAKTRTVRFYISSSAIFFFSSLPRAISYLPPDRPYPRDDSTRRAQIDFSRRCSCPTYIIIILYYYLLYIILYLCTNVTAPLLILYYAVYNE